MSRSAFFALALTATLAFPLAALADDHAAHLAIGDPARKDHAVGLVLEALARDLLKLDLHWVDLRSGPSCTGRAGRAGRHPYDVAEPGGCPLRAGRSAREYREERRKGQTVRQATELLRERGQAPKARRAAIPAMAMKDGLSAAQSVDAGAHDHRRRGHSSAGGVARRSGAGLAGSAQRSLPGLSIPRGSSADLMARIAAISAGLREWLSQSRLSVPMPCSADTDPPRSRTSP